MNELKRQWLRCVKKYLYSVYGAEDPLNFERVYRFTGLAGCCQLARIVSE